MVIYCIGRLLVFFGNGNGSGSRFILACNILISFYAGVNPNEPEVPWIEKLSG